jgi:hypothetical protein
MTWHDTNWCRVIQYCINSSSGSASLLSHYQHSYEYFTLSGLLTFAPASKSADTTAAWPLMTAQSRAVWPPWRQREGVEEVQSDSVQYRMQYRKQSSRTHSRPPLNHRYRRLTLSTWLLSAPLFMSSNTTGVWPCSTAYMRGVLPSWQMD